MLEVQGISVRRGSVEVVRDASFKLGRGEFIALVGRNGAGKTSLMKAIAGLLPSSTGHISMNGQSLDAMPAHQRIRLGIGYMPEDRRLIPGLTVEENISLPCWTRNTPDLPSRLAEVFKWIPELEPMAQRRALELSGGQQKLVALARAWVADNSLLLLDEPFEGVAPALCQRLIEVIRTLRQAGMAVLLSESEFKHSRGLVDHVLPIDRGVLQPVVLGKNVAAH
jgi:branched-chain amino acid transport system ATP-binding protein